MSLKSGDSRKRKRGSRIYHSARYSYAILDGGDFEVFCDGKSVAIVESRSAVEELIAVLNGD